jgi:hypothetical protein
MTRALRRLASAFTLIVAMSGGFPLPAAGAALTCQALFKRLTAPKISARESGILDRAVLRDFEDLGDFSAPSREIAGAWNRRVIDALHRLKTPEVAGLSQREIDELVAEVKANEVIEESCATPSRYEKDPEVSIGFCFGRAVGVHLLARQRNLSNDSIRKFWLMGEMETGDVTWSHHVATGIRGDDGQWFVINPATTTLQPVEAWLKDWQGISTDGQMTLFATKADRFGPDARDPLFESTTEPDSYNGFFHDLFAGARREGEDVAQQLDLLSREGLPKAAPKKARKKKTNKKPAAPRRPASRNSA